MLYQIGIPGCLEQTCFTKRTDEGSKSKQRLFFVSPDLSQTSVLQRSKETGTYLEF